MFDYIDNWISAEDFRKYSKEAKANNIFLYAPYVPLQISKVGLAKKEQEDICNHRFIPLFTGICCKKRGMEKPR